MAQFGIQLTSDEQDQGSEIDPKQKKDENAKNARNLVVVANVGHIGSERLQKKKPQD